MEIKTEAQVVDRNGKVVGSVNHVARDGWSGEIKKFIVNRKPPEKDIFFTPDDVLEITDNKIKIKIALNESSQELR